MERAVSLFKNKYFISALSFVAWMLFFDRYDVATQYGYHKEKAKLERERDFYNIEIGNIEKAIKDVQFNPSEIQKIAREKYKMKKANEDVYVITELQSSED